VDDEDGYSATVRRGALCGDCVYGEPDEPDEGVCERVETPVWEVVSTVADWSGASPSVTRRPVLELEASAFCVRFRAGALPGALLVCLRLSRVPCLSPAHPGAWAGALEGRELAPERANKTPAMPIARPLPPAGGEGRAPGAQ